MVIFQQMLIFFIMIGIGMIASSTKILTKENQPQISKLVVNIAAPCLIVSGAATAGPRMALSELAYCFGIILVLMVVMIALGYLLPLLLRYPKDQRGTANVMFLMNNVAFIGLPLISSTFGDGAIIYMTLFLIPNNALMYTYGITTISKGSDAPALFGIKQLINPGTVACVVTIALYLSGLTLPYVLSQTVSMVGGLTAPLAMMLIGSSLMELKPKELLCDLRLNIFTVIKMVIIPIIVLLAFKQFISNEYLLGVCLVALATPTGAMVVMLATLYNRNTYQLAAKAVSLTTIVSVATLPLVSLVTGIG